uniref:DUF229 domain-containing protein n=1 Tax=Glossina pallidipes TaxID=7398 RepID=A0A1A9ZN61_GLOPL
MSLYEKRKSNGEMNINYEGKYLLDPRYMTKRDLQYYYRYYNMTKKRRQFKKIIFLVLCLCFFSYIFIDYNLKTKLLQLKDHFEFIPRIDADYNITQAYFVDLPGCRMPYFPVTDDNIIQFMFRPQNFTCKKSLTRTADHGSYLLLNMNANEIKELYGISDIESITCNYTEIKRIDDQHNRYMESLPLKLHYNQQLPIKEYVEFLKVECWDSNHNSIHKDFHFFILDKMKGDDRELRRSSIEPMTSPVKGLLSPPAPEILDKTTQPPRPHSNFSTDRISVMILGIDSVSHLNFLRQMRMTSTHIHQNLNHVEFWGYNKVGDNTYPNLIPALSGLDESELAISCLGPTPHSAKYDKCSFIWKRYKDAGYRTAYAEDVGLMGLFSYCRSGFKRPPTDYYLHPILVEMEQHISYMKSFNVELCKGGRRTVDVVLEFVRKLIPYLATGNFFSFFWTVTMTHDMFNMPMLLDADIKDLLRIFEMSGVLNRTVIFLMSDHGLRWGSFRKTYQGMMEERLPLLITLYPDWLKRKYPAAIANMESNTKRLTTPFDLYATMLDLLDMRTLEKHRLETRASELMDADNIVPRGISLFLPIPETRSCDNANIASHWCTCHQRENLPTNDGRVQRAARYIVKLINERLKPFPQCRILYLNSILEAIVAAPHHKIVKEEGLSDYAIDVTLRIQTKPGLGLFESTVRMSSYSTSLTGTISRINLYSSQSYCIDDYAFKMFCYCHR